MRSSLVKKKRAETEPSSLMTQTKNQLKAETSPEPSLDVKKMIKMLKSKKNKVRQMPEEVSKPDSENN